MYPPLAGLKSRTRPIWAHFRRPVRIWTVWMPGARGYTRRPSTSRISSYGGISNQSGQYWTPYVRVNRGLDYNASVGRYITLVSRGAEQFDDRHLIDLRLAWGLSLANAMRLELSLECFNVTNEDTVLRVAGRWGDYRLSTGAWSRTGSYGTASQIESPRQIRAGIRFEF